MTDGVGGGGGRVASNLHLLSLNRESLYALKGPRCIEKRPPRELFRV